MSAEVAMVRRSSVEPAVGRKFLDSLRALSSPLQSNADLDPLIERIGSARVVLLGEASHGTSEFYTWRAAITRRLIEEKGFNFVAVEGDWPDCYQVNRFVKGYPGSARTAEEALATFRRWPTWMWANREVQEFAT
jgi:erythromycin esterase-like protein